MKAPPERPVPRPAEEAPAPAEPAPEPTIDPADYAPPPVSVRIGRHLFSGAPKVIDERSCTTLLSALRYLQRVKNLDGPDDIAGAVPAGFSKVDQPYIEIGLLALLFPLVVISAWGAYKNAVKGYRVEYPEMVAFTLNQQQALIDSLRRDSRPQADRMARAQCEHELATLVRLHEEGLASFRKRWEKRGGHFYQLVGHNLRQRLHRAEGNGDLSLRFNEEARRLVEQRMQDRQVATTAETSYQFALLDKTESQRHASKQERSARLFTGVGMNLMADGMMASATSSAATAAADSATRAGHLAQAVAAQLAAHAADVATTTIMSTAQALQGASGALHLHLHHREYARLKDDLAALNHIAEAMSPEVCRLYQQDVRFRLQASLRSQVLDGALSTGQALMLASSVGHFLFPGAALGLAVPGAVLTVAASIGSSVNDGVTDAFMGESTAANVKAGHVQGNLGLRLRHEGPEALIESIAEGYAGQQAWVEQTQLWNDILSMLDGEDILAPWPTRSAAQRRDAVTINTLKTRNKSRLLADGVKNTLRLRRRKYPTAFFDRPLLQIHQAIAAEMQLHPSAAIVGPMESFRQAVLDATVEALARQPRSAESPLFRDADGKRPGRIAADQAFLDFIEHDPVASAIHCREHNRALARALVPGNQFGRAERQNALTDLARGQRRRDMLARKHRLEPAGAASAIHTASGNEQAVRRVLISSA